MRKWRRVLAGVLSLSMVFMCSCLDDVVLDDRDGGGLFSAFSSQDGTLKINRSIRPTTKPMGEDGTWTVFVYLCGTDLESKNGMATKDLKEMVKASIKDNVRYVVQTGGTKKWTCDVSSGNIERYEICNGEMSLVDSQPKKSMGDSAVLADFLRWGVDNYAAAKMGLVLWNHGGGSVTGICFDENSHDSLSLKEVDAALYSVYDQMTAPFEFIGFDACLMGTVEMASILATHAKYMIASEELEPGYGWNYTKLGNYLAKNPNADGKELGKVICDSYYEDCESIYSEDEATLAVIDLSQIDNLIVNFHAYAEDLYKLSDKQDTLSVVARNIGLADNFGGNNKTEGYTNMVDFGGLIRSGASYSEHAAAAMDALSKAVVYQRKGEKHSNASGLSVYYPLQMNGSEELRIFRDICISSYYLGFIDKIAYGAANSGQVAGYNNSGIFDMLLNDWSSSQYDTVDGFYSYSMEEDGEWDYIDDCGAAGQSSAISFAAEPYLDEDGTYGFALTEEGLYNTESVQSIVYMISEDGEDIIELGLSSDIYADWDEGVFTDNFDGSWFCLPDGQMLAAYLIEEGEGYDVFTAPVLLNDEETNLRFVWDYEEGTVSILDIWGGMDEDGAACRDVIELSEGDVIVPMYYAWGIDSDEEFTYYGDEYVFDGDPEIFFDAVPDGNYLYAFHIDDIFGGYFETDYVGFTVDGEDIWFEDFS